MYTYFFKLTPSRNKSTINFLELEDNLRDAQKNVNSGTAFQRDGKQISIDFASMEPRAIYLTLTCKTPLLHAARSLSALTRYLVSHGEFSEYIYNKTLFNTELLSQDSSFGKEISEISDTDMLKGVIDLLYTYTTSTKKEADARLETINQIKTLIAPYLS